MSETKRDDSPEPPQRVGVREFRANLTVFLRQARQGQAFLVTSHDTVLAELRPPAKPEASIRRPGALRGRIRMADDFDELPAELLAEIENDEQ